MMDSAVRFEFNGGTNSKKIVTSGGGGGGGEHLMPKSSHFSHSGRI